MSKCEICNGELKLDLYTRTYFCPRCREIDASKNSCDILVIYKELNDLNRRTYESDYAEKMITTLSQNYTVEQNKADVRAKMVVVFASKSSYLYSFRKFWSSYTDKSIVLVLKDLRGDDLPLELRDKCIIQMDSPSYIDEAIGEYKILNEAIKEHVEEIKESIDDSFNNDSISNKIADEMIKNKINAGVKENKILESIKTECEENHTHGINPQAKPAKKEDKEYIHELLFIDEFDEALRIIDSNLKIYSNDAELYMLRLMANLKLHDVSELREYSEKPLDEYEDCRKALSVAEPAFKKQIEKILADQSKEMLYKKALSYLEGETMPVKIKYGLSLLDEIIPYKDSGKLYEQYSAVLNGYINIGDTSSNKTYSSDEVIRKINKTFDKKIGPIIFIIFGLIFFLIISSIVLPNVIRFFVTPAAFVIAIILIVKTATKK